MEAFIDYFVLGEKGGKDDERESLSQPGLDA